MTREEAKTEINKVFEPAFANYIITALTEGATPSERKTGRWKAYVDFGNHRHLLCSCCGNEGYNTRFCPECGAEMKGAEDEKN